MNNWKKEMGWDGHGRIESIFVIMDNKENVPYEEISWLIDELERFHQAAVSSEKYINGTAKLFSHRNKESVLSELNKALLPWRLLPDEV